MGGGWSSTDAPGSTPQHAEAPPLKAPGTVMEGAGSADKGVGKLEGAVAVGPSSVHGAGEGLFAMRDFGVGEDVVEYSGEVLDFARARAARNRSYIKMVSLNRHIDAADPAKSSLARYINDNADSSKINAEFYIVDKTNVKVRAMRAIRKDEEIFVSYGRGHWLFCTDAHLAGSFLGLAVRNGVLEATRSLQAKETAFVYSSGLWPDDHYYGPGFGHALQRGAAANCRLQKNPFVLETVMVVTSRDIAAGEALVLPQEVPTCVVLILSKDAAWLRPLLAHQAGCAGKVLLCDDGAFTDSEYENVMNRLDALLKVLQAPCLPPRVVWLHVTQGTDAELVSAAHNFVPVNPSAPEPSLARRQPNAGFISVRPNEKLGDKRYPKTDVRDLAHRLENRGLNVGVSPGPAVENSLYYLSLVRSTERAGQWGHDDSLLLHIKPCTASEEAAAMKALVEGVISLV